MKTMKLLIFVVALWTSLVCNQILPLQEQIVNEIPHPPHVRATLDNPSVHFAEEIQKRRQELAEEIKEEAILMKDKVKEKVTGTVQKVSNGISDTAESIQNKMEENWESFTEAAGDLKEKIKVPATKTMETIEEKLGSFQEAAFEMKDKIGDKLEEAKQAIEEKISPTKTNNNRKSTHWTEHVANFKNSLIIWLKYFFKVHPYTSETEKKKNLLSHEIFPGRPEARSHKSILKGTLGELQKVGEETKELIGDVRDRSKYFGELIGGKVHKVEENLEEKFQGAKSIPYDKNYLPTYQEDHSPYGSFPEDIVEESHYSYHYTYKKFRPSEGATRQFVVTHH